MKRIDDDTIALTQSELYDIRHFIRSSLDKEWDRYTDIYICSDKWEEGMRRMNPEMYDMAEEMSKL